MKMRNIFLFIAAVLSGTDIQAQTATADASHTVYVVDISARNLSLKAVDSSPAKTAGGNIPLRHDQNRTYQHFQPIRRQRTRECRKKRHIQPTSKVPGTHIAFSETYEICEQPFTDNGKRSGHSFRRDGKNMLRRNHQSIVIFQTHGFRFRTRRGARCRKIYDRTIGFGHHTRQGDLFRSHQHIPGFDATQRHSGTYGGRLLLRTGIQSQRFARMG